MQLSKKEQSELLQYTEGASYTQAARLFLKNNSNCKLSIRTLRKYASMLEGEVDSNYSDELIPFQGTPEEYAESLGIDKKDIKSFKSYTYANGRQGYSFNISKDKDVQQWYAEVGEYFSTKENITLPKNLHITGKEGVVTTADWHIGAYIRDLISTNDYDLGILKKYLKAIAGIINQLRFRKVHLTINGDLIESFSGMNHQGTFKELELWGKNALLTCYEVITWWIQQIDNVESITIISGNHDRTQAHKELEYEGEVAGIIAYFLKEKLDCKVNYHPYVYNLEVDGISYILCHGDKKFINNPSDIAWKYGKQGMYNCIIAAHKHTRQKSDAVTTKTLQSIVGDSNGLRLLYCPSLFTGNFYSENLGFTSDAGFYAITNFYGKPFVQDIPLSMELLNSLSL